MDDKPISLGAVRAERSGNGAAWTPRDVLRDATERSADADAMVIVWRSKSANGVTQTHFAQCGPDVHTALGLLEAAKLDIYNKAEN